MILGHDRQIVSLEKVQSSGRLAHAYFFHGPEQVGKFTIARSFARMMLCDQKPSRISDTCGVCDSCRRVENEVSPNLLIFSRDRSLDGPVESRKDIPIDDIRELKRILSFAPEPDLWRIVIIDGVEHLSIPAANAFLKLLEEPGERILILLISQTPELVLQTIRSRAQPVRFGTVAESVLAVYAKNQVTAKESDILVAASAGRPGKLINLLSDPASAKKEEKLLTELFALKSASVPELLLFTGRIAKDQENEDQVWFLAWQILRREFLAQHADQTRTLEKIHLLDRIGTLRETTNVSARLALDAFLLEYRG